MVWLPGVSDGRGSFPSKAGLWPSFFSFSMEGSFLLLPQPEEVAKVPGTNASQGDPNLGLDLVLQMKRLSSRGGAMLRGASLLVRGLQFSPEC